MKFFPIWIDNLETEDFINATDTQVATWMRLHALCSKQLNGGIIEGIEDRTAQFWGRHGIEAGVIREGSPLWAITDDDLHLHYYDLPGQERYEKQVEDGRKGGLIRAARVPSRVPSTHYPTQPDPRSPDITQPNPNPRGDEPQANNGPGGVSEGFLGESGGILDSLYRKVETLHIDPGKRIAAQKVARELEAEPGTANVNDPVAVFMSRLKKAGIIGKAGSQQKAKHNEEDRPF